VVGACGTGLRKEGFPRLSCRSDWSIAIARALPHTRSRTTAIPKRVTDSMAFLSLPMRPLVHTMLPQGSSYHILA